MTDADVWRYYEREYSAEADALEEACTDSVRAKVLDAMEARVLRKRSRAYVAPPPVYAECPSCRATVRVLPSGRWATHADSLLYPVGVRLYLWGRCYAGGRMRS